MSFTITIDFDLTPGDLELLKAIGERANEGTLKPDGGRYFGTYADAVKDLLREALRAKDPVGAVRKMNEAIGGCVVCGRGYSQPAITDEEVDTDEGLMDENSRLESEIESLKKQKAQINAEIAFSLGKPIDEEPTK